MSYRYLACRLNYPLSVFSIFAACSIYCITNFTWTFQFRTLCGRRTNFLRFQVLQPCQGLTVRRERKAQNFLCFVQLGYIIILLRRL